MKESELEKLDAPTVASTNERYVLRLCVTGATPASTRAIVNLRKICEDHLRGRYELEVVDISRHPEMATNEQIVALPTLVKKLPQPLRRFIGDLSQIDRVLLGLDIPDPAERPESLPSKSPAPL